jgi:hypothetical protein
MANHLPRQDAKMVANYSSESECSMRHVFDTLGERDRRLYAAVEAQKLGHGGIAYIANLLNCDRKTIRRGLQEIQTNSNLSPGRSRKKGAVESPV